MVLLMNIDKDEFSAILDFIRRIREFDEELDVVLSFYTNELFSS